MKHQKLNDPLTEHLRRVQNSNSLIIGSIISGKAVSGGITLTYKVGKTTEDGKWVTLKPLDGGRTEMYDAKWARSLDVVTPGAKSKD
jgi:hypothetical protein